MDEPKEVVLTAEEAALIRIRLAEADAVLARHGAYRPEVLGG